MLYVNYISINLKKNKAYISHTPLLHGGRYMSGSINQMHQYETDSEVSYVGTHVGHGASILLVQKHQRLCGFSGQRQPQLHEWDKTAVCIWELKFRAHISSPHNNSVKKFLSETGKRLCCLQLLTLNNKEIKEGKTRYSGTCGTITKHFTFKKSQSQKQR